LTDTKTGKVMGYLKKNLQSPNAPHHEDVALNSPFGKRERLQKNRKKSGNKKKTRRKNRK